MFANPFNVDGMNMFPIPFTVEISCVDDTYPRVPKPTKLEVIVDWTVEIVDK